MDFRIYKKEQQKESNWSGGKTWELAIFPEEGRARSIWTETSSGV